jgi:beta-glucosidase
VYASRPAQGGSASPDDFVSRLAAFARVDLEPGESRKVALPLEPRLLARWDVDACAFRVAGGRYEVRIGAHAHDEDGTTSTVRLAPAVLS